MEYQPRKDINPDIVRSMIQHEDNLINQRLSWTFTTQSFLIAGLSFLWGKDKSQLLIAAIAVFGVITNGSILYSLLDAINAINKLKSLGRKLNLELSPIPVQGSSDGIDYLFPWFVVPVSLILFWVVTLLITLFQA